MGDDYTIERLLEENRKLGEANTGLGTALSDEHLENIRLREALAEYGLHTPDCLLHYWEAGEPIQRWEGGELIEEGYRQKYKGQWYDSDSLPKCECGLDAALNPSAGADRRSAKDD